MYEHRGRKPISSRAFLRRLGAHFAIVLAIVGASIGIGMAGYEHFERLSWRDAFLNVAMLLGGMGPVNPPVTDDGKVFAAIFALYAGLVFLVAASLVLAPVAHRVLHRFHWETTTDDGK